MTHDAPIYFQAREDYLRVYDLRREYDDSYTTVLGLHFDVAPMHFRGSSMVLKCTSSLLSVYWQSSEVSKNGIIVHFRLSRYWFLWLVVEKNDKLQKGKNLGEK